MAHCHGVNPGTRRPNVRPFPINYILKALKNSSVDSLIRVMALEKDAPDLPCQRK
jgi:hypothetical protein